MPRLELTKWTGRVRTQVAAPSLELHQKRNRRYRVRVLDACERDRAKARNDVGVGEPIKAINAVRRPECDAHAGFGFAPNKLDQATTQRATQQRVLAPNSVFISR